MKLFLYIIAIFWIAVGTAFIVFPKKTKTFYACMVKPVRSLFILPLLIGLLLLWASPASRFEVFIRILGIAAIIKGVFILAFPVRVTRSVIQHFLSQSDKNWKLYGIFILLLGIVTAWSVV